MSMSMSIYTEAQMKLLKMKKPGGVLPRCNGTWRMFQKKGRNDWSDFGGKREGGEIAHETIWREAREEGTLSEGGITKVYDVFLDKGYVLIVAEVNKDPVVPKKGKDAGSTIIQVEKYSEVFNRHVRLNNIEVLRTKLKMIEDAEAEAAGPVGP